MSEFWVGVLREPLHGGLAWDGVKWWIGDLPPSNWDGWEDDEEEDDFMGVGI